MLATSRLCARDFYITGRVWWSAPYLALYTGRVWWSAPNLALYTGRVWWSAPNLALYTGRVWWSAPNLALYTGRVWWSAPNLALYTGRVWWSAPNLALFGWKLTQLAYGHHTKRETWACFVSAKGLALQCIGTCSATIGSQRGEFFFLRSLRHFKPPLEVLLTLSSFSFLSIIVMEIYRFGSPNKETYFYNRILK